MLACERTVTGAKDGGAREMQEVTAIPSWTPVVTLDAQDHVEMDCGSAAPVPCAAEWRSLVIA